MDSKFTQILTDTFEDDALWKQIHLLNLQQYLFDEKLLDKLDMQTTYSLTQAAEFLGVKDHNLRNYLNRHYLDEYVQTERIGKLYRLNYKSIFRFHMIFILVNYGNRTPTDIASYVGTKVELVHKTSRSAKPGSVINDSYGLSTEQTIGEYAERLENVEKTLVFLNMMIEKEQKKNLLDKAERDLIDWERQVALLGQEIENLELKKQIKKQERKSIELVKETHKKINTEVSPSGFLKSLFSKDKAKNYNYDQAVEQSVSTVENIVDRNQSLVIDIDENINRLKEEVDNLQSQKGGLYDNKERCLKELEMLEKKFEYYKGSIEGVHSDNKANMVEHLND